MEYLKGVKEDGVCVVYDFNMMIKFTDDGIISIKNSNKSIDFKYYIEAAFF